MKRTPLQRRTPLKTRTPLQGSSLKGGGGTLRRTGPVAPRSPKRQADMVGRRALVATLLAERPTCEARWLCRGARAVDVHERLSRARGGNILDPVQAHMMTVCRDCHNHITTHPADAEARRLAFPSWHTCPPVGPC